MMQHKSKYWLITILYTLFIFVTLPITPALWKYLQSSLGHFPLYFLYLIYLSGTIIILGYLFSCSQERGITIYLKFAAIATIFGYYLKTITIPAEKTHLMEYALLSYFIGKAFQLEDTKNQDIRYFQAFLLITFIGSLDEGIQYYLPNRVFDIKDILMNSLAGFLGLACFRLIIYSRPLESFKAATEG